MCGILGFATVKPSADNAKYFKRILRLSSSRGADATGIAYVDGKRIIVAKEPISSGEFIKDVLPKYIDGLAKTKIALGHTRTPTMGTPKDNNNNHPVESKDWILIHNGTVTCMERLKDYKYKGQVDSEVLLSYVQEYGLEKGLPYVGRGSAAVALINRSELDTIYLWREANPIKIAHDEASNTVFFASQEDFLEKGLANKLLLFTSFQIKDLPLNLLVKISVDPLKVEAIDYIAVHKSSYYSCGSSLYGNSNFYETPPPVTSSLGLSYNKETNRWETLNRTTGSLASTPSTGDGVGNKKEKEKKEKNTETAKTMLNKALMDLGYTPDEISRMTDGTIATILYKGTPATDVGILPNGTIKEYIASNPPYNSGLPNKYYFQTNSSRDFRGWFKLTLPNKGYLSADGLLIKKWDKAKLQHFIITWQDAVSEKLIEEVSLQKDYDGYMGLTEEENNLPIEEQE